MTEPVNPKAVQMVIHLLKKRLTPPKQLPDDIEEFLEEGRSVVLSPEETKQVQQFIECVKAPMIDIPWEPLIRQYTSFTKKQYLVFLAKMAQWILDCKDDRTFAYYTIRGRMEIITETRQMVEAMGLMIDLQEEFRDDQPPHEEGIS